MRALALFAGLALSACGGSDDSRRNEQPESSSTITPPDGRWLVTHADGKAVRKGEFLVEIIDGSIKSGYDGCKRWAFVEDKPGVIESTLQGCGTSKPREAYEAVVFIGKPRFAEAGGDLLITSGKHALRATNTASADQPPSLIGDGRLPE